MKRTLLFFCAAFACIVSFAQSDNDMQSFASSETQTATEADFRAIMNNGKVDLQWRSLGTDVTVYTLERSRNNSNFEAVATVQAPGSSGIQVDFAETDFSPYPGISYYRLRTTGPTGSFTYSVSVPVNYLFAHDNVTIFPNPASSGEQLSLSFNAEENEDVLVVLKNSEGHEFYSKVFLSTTEKQVAEIAPGMDLPPGTYIVTASSKNFLYSKKIIIR